MLKLESMTNDFSIQQNENFRLVAQKNMITNVTIENKCVLEGIQLIVILCSWLEHLTIRTSRDFFVQILRFLLSKTNENTRHLFSLCIVDLSEELVQSLEFLLESEGLFDDYSFRFFDNKLCLWW
jgi:hypothetical protein